MAVMLAPVQQAQKDLSDSRLLVYVQALIDDEISKSLLQKGPS